MNIWFKTFIKNKLKISKSYAFDNEASLFDILVFCCNELDLPCPVILPKHEKYFKDFGITKFLKSDFVETIPYDYVEIEAFE